MKRTKFSIVAGMAMLTVIWGACSSTGLTRNTPENVLKAFLKAGNDGKYSEAERYLSSATKPLAAARGGVKRYLDQATRDGKIESVEIVKVEVRGEGAKVYYKIHYKDGQMKDDNEELIKENGEWKIGG